MRECFDSARRQAPAVVFIDEVDAFADRSKVTHDHKDYVIEVVNGLLEQLDGLAGREGLIFIAASNDVRRCDPAILRAGRLNRVIRVPLPNREDLVKMLRVRLRDDLREIALDEAALMAAGYTGADVERAVKDARRGARQEERAMTLDDLMGAIAGPEDTRDVWALRRSAIHEAGHALLAARDFGAERVTVTIRRRGNTGGGVHVSNRGDESLSTRADLDREVIRLLAGPAAEDVLLCDLGVGAGGGADSDLARATAHVASMAFSFGLIGSMPLLYQGALIEGNALVLTPSMQKIVHAALVKRYARARALIRENRRIVEAIADALLERKTLSGVELGHIVASPPPQDEDEDGSFLLVDPDIDEFDELDLGVEVFAPWASPTLRDEGDLYG